MNTIREELSKLCRFKKVTGIFGIEIETETKSSEDYPDGFFRQDGENDQGSIRYSLPMPEWEGHTDNSLRHFGMEYVLKEPLSYPDTLKALVSFKKGTEDVKFLKGSPATSVHVHLNMLDRTFVEMANFITLYSLFENVLVDYSGPARRSNLFALPMRVAERTVGNIKNLLKEIAEGGTTFNVHPEHVKYASLNLAPLMTRGSLEIRSFRGTTDVSEIKEWVSILNQLYVFAQIEGLTPRSVMSSYKNLGMEFFTEVFGLYRQAFKDIQDIEVLIERNLWYMTEIATCVPDWSKLTAPYSSKVKEVKEIKKKSVYTTLDDVIQFTEEPTMLQPLHNFNTPPNWEIN